MADLFGEWIPDEWIQQVIDTVRDNPQWNFLFLTKNPKRYLDFEFPKNCALGATAATQKQATTASEVFAELVNRDDDHIKFLSCEPLIEHIVIDERDDNHFDYEETMYFMDVDWLINGARSKSSKMPAMQPDWSWVMSLIMQAERCNVPYYFKPNLTVRPKQTPWDNTKK